MLAGGVAVLLLIALSARAIGPAPQASAPIAAGSTSGPSITQSASASPTGPSASPTTSAQASGSPPAATADQTPSPADATAARNAVEQYTAALVRGDYATAYGMLAPESRAQWQSLADYIYERSAYFKTIAGRYVIRVWPTDIGPITGWLTDDNRSLIDLHHAVLVEVDYPALDVINGGVKNAGIDIFIVSPGANGLEIFEVR
jgi:hypothetical protein